MFHQKILLFGEVKALAGNRSDVEVQIPLPSKEQQQQQQATTKNKKQHSAPISTSKLLGHVFVEICRANNWAPAKAIMNQEMKKKKHSQQGTHHTTACEKLFALLIGTAVDDDDDHNGEETPEGTTAAAGAQTPTTTPTTSAKKRARANEKMEEDATDIEINATDACNDAGRDDLDGCGGTPTALHTCCVIAHNEEYCAFGESIVLVDGDELAVIPPISGG